MAMNDYWAALSLKGRIGLIGGSLAIVAATGAIGFWALRDPLVPLLSALAPERQAEAMRELDRLKIPYRVADDGTTVLVAQSSIGKARSVLGSGGIGLPPSAGLELFKEADFSTTDFAQRVNYQRALQGELTRTLHGMAGVRSARVHVILPEAGLLKRNKTKASVAITLQLAPGKTLSPAQVAGIQRLAAASVPEIQAADVVVLDESGNTLSRNASTAESEGSVAQLDLKRQVDGYLEGKLSRLLTDLAPLAQVTLSVDASLDFKQVKVTTEEPLAAAGANGDHPTGVVTRERQSQRGGEAQQGKANGREDVADWEYEYKVGQRVEQSLSVPGAIKRISVAAAIHGAPDALGVGTVEALVGHAVGIDRARGDSVAVVLLPGSVQAMSTTPVSSERAPVQFAPEGIRAEAQRAFSTPLLLAMGMLGLTAIAWPLARRGVPKADPQIDVDAATAKVRAWLNDGTAPR